MQLLQGAPNVFAWRALKCGRTLLSGVMAHSEVPLVRIREYKGKKKSGLARENSAFSYYCTSNSSPNGSVFQILSTFEKVPPPSPSLASFSFAISPSFSSLSFFFSSVVFPAC